MIETDIEKIIRVIKLQAEVFLLAAKEFYPFGTYINSDDKIVPVGAYPGGEHPASADVIELLEKGFSKNILDGECKMAAIALDIFINQGNEKYDAIELRFFEPGKEVYKRAWRYIINEGHVNFIEFKENRSFNDKTIAEIYITIHHSLISF